MYLQTSMMEVLCNNYAKLFSLSCSMHSQGSIPDLEFLGEAFP